MSLELPYFFILQVKLPIALKFQWLFPFQHPATQMNAIITPFKIVP